MFLHLGLKGEQLQAVLQSETDSVEEEGTLVAAEDYLSSTAIETEGAICRRVSEGGEA